MNKTGNNRVTPDKCAEKCINSCWKGCEWIPQEGNKMRGNKE